MQILSADLRPVEAARQKKSALRAEEAEERREREQEKDGKGASWKLRKPLIESKAKKKVREAGIERAARVREKGEWMRGQ